MRLALLLAFLLGSLWTVSGQETSQNIALTVYNHGTALIRERHRLDLEQGISAITIDGVAASIDPTSVSLQSLGNPAGFSVLEQHYRYDLGDRETLLSRYLDKVIHITASDGTVYSGALLHNDIGTAMLRLDSGDLALINLNGVRDVRLPASDALITRPTLQWLVNSSVADAQDVELTYLADGINWTADYNVLLGADGDSLDIQGRVTLNNHSGRAFHDVQLKLVAGDIQRVQPQPMLAESRLVAFDAAEQASGVEQRELFEYQLYEVKRPVSINGNETRQIEWVSAANVAAARAFVFDSSPRFGGYYAPIDYPQGHGSPDAGGVLTYLQFSTGGEGGLDADLPGGRMRVYQADVDGAGLLIGEGLIDHTPAGGEVSILLGKAFDLAGERTQTDFALVSRDVIQESFEIRLHNRKDDEAVEIRIPERLYRWSDWKIIESSAPYERKSASMIEFRLELAPGDERVLTYSVQYSLPRNR